MTEDRQRQLSALVDGALDAPQSRALLDALKRDQTLSATWERYHLIGQALRGEPIDQAARGIADRVHQAIASDPLPIRRPVRAPANLFRIAPFIGAALAASAAFLVVFAVPGLISGPGARLAEAPAANLASAGSPAITTPVGSPRRWHLDQPELTQKLDLFLVNHQEMAPATGVKGMLPYATLVGYESPR